MMASLPYRTRVRLLNDYSGVVECWPGYGALGYSGTAGESGVWVEFDNGALIDVPLAHLELIVVPDAPRTRGMQKLQEAIVELLELGTMARDIRDKLSRTLKDKTILGKVRVKLNVLREAQRRAAAESRNMSSDILNCVWKLNECDLVTIARAVCPRPVPDYAQVRSLIDNLVSQGKLTRVGEDRWRIQEPQA